MIKLTFTAAALLLTFSSLLAGCQQQTTSAEPLNAALVAPSAIQVLADRRTLTPDALVDELSRANMLIIGEIHDDPRHHAIEEWLMMQLAQKRPQGSVLLEMLNSDQQSNVSELQLGMRSDPYLRDQRIQELLRWQTGWPWSLYRGVVMSGLRGTAPLLAANLSRQQIDALYDNPQFPDGEQSANPQAREVLRAAIVAMHDGNIAAGQLTSMLAIQQNRDRFMAERLMQAPRPALLIAGSYHAAKNIGVPLHLQDLAAPRPVVLILATRGTQLSEQAADYVWYLPALDQG